MSYSVLETKGTKISRRLITNIWWKRKNPYLCTVVGCDDSLIENKYRCLTLRMPVFLFLQRLFRGRCRFVGRSEKTRTLTLLAIMKKRVSHLTVQATTRVVVLKLVRVRAYIRFHLGRKEKVRSHWRRYRVACSETSVTVSK